MSAAGPLLDELAEIGATVQSADNRRLIVRAGLQAVPAELVERLRHGSNPRFHQHVQHAASPARRDIGGPCVVTAAIAYRTIILAIVPFAQVNEDDSSCRRQLGPLVSTAGLPSRAELLADSQDLRSVPLADIKEPDGGPCPMRRASVAKSPIRSSLAARWYPGLTTDPNVISSSWSHVGWSTVVGRSLYLTTVRLWHQERKAAGR
jgi:hypothetical protein